MRVVCYFGEGGMLLWRGWYATLKRVECYFDLQKLCKTREIVAIIVGKVALQTGMHGGADPHKQEFI